MDPRQRIGKYELTALLGTGGMGAVYKAVDPHLGRTVALKLLAPGMQQNAELRERFLREARAAGGLQHPNIVVIHDLGEEAGELYIAMEFLAGETLADMLARRGVLPVPEAVEIMAQVARGLHYAHERGVVHRDVKPQNIMVTSEGLAKIVDFGIARAGDQRLTKTGHVMGTVFYMSPEQINGKAMDGRSDVFSAGVVLYEMLTGKVPFEGESTGATMMKIMMEPPPPLRMAAPLSPPELETVVATALAKQPEQRYASAAAFAKALQAIARRFPTGSHAMPEAAGEVTRAYAAGMTGADTVIGSVGAAPARAAVRPTASSSQPGTPPPAAPSRWWTSSTLKYAFAFVLVALIGGGSWYALKPSASSVPIPTSTGPLIGSSASPTPSPVPTTPAPDLKGTYDLLQENQVVGELTIFNQTSDGEFAVRAKEWNAQGHITGREGYYDWRFTSGELAGQTGRTTFTVQENGELVGKVQGDRPELKWAYLAKPRVKAAQPPVPAGPAAVGAAAEAPVRWPSGNWSGMAHQDSTNHDWTVRVTVSDGTYRIAYPSLDCSGTLTPTKVNEAIGIFTEHITGGTGSCVDGGTVTLMRYTNGQMQFTWEGAGDSVTTRLSKE